MIAPVLIAGGGIGGLAAAVGLSRAGVPSIVLEQAPVLAEIGAGIQIAPNAFNCFDALGIGERVGAGAVFIEKLRLMDAVSGEEVVHIPLDAAFRERFGNPYAVIHRADLHTALLEACEASKLVSLHTSQAATGYEQDGQGVRVRCANGKVFEGSALIGADGLRSAIRQQLIGDGEPKVSGHSTYRSVIPTEAMPEDLRWNAATLWAGPKCHIVHYPLKGWKLFNLVVTYHDDAAEPAVGVPASIEEVRRGFEHIHPRAQQIIEHGRDWKRWVLCDREPTENWTDGRVALLGDAAHPMLQYFAQGAAMAMEDAVAIAQAVAARPNDIPAALAAYQAERLVRTARVQIHSRLIGEFIYHPSGARAQVRNAIMQGLSAHDYYDRLDWLYGQRPAPISEAAA